MDISSQVIISLKQALKVRGINYRELAVRLEVSEVTIKRVFSNKEITLKRFGEICQTCNIDPWVVIKEAQRKDSPSGSMPLEAEELLAIDQDLLLLLYLLLFNESQLKIRKRLKISTTKFYSMARDLERIGVVEVLPGNQIKLLVQKTVRWNPGGPLSVRYADAIKEEFFNTNFSKEGEFQDFLTIPLTPANAVALKQKLQSLFSELEMLGEHGGDSKESETYWVYVGTRKWAPFEVIERSKNLPRDA
jgi:hypothetical protein